MLNCYFHSPWLVTMKLLRALALPVVLFFSSTAHSSPTTSSKEDTEALLQFVAPFAEQQLGKHGEFLPFGAGMTATGEIVATGAGNGDETPLPADIIAMMQEFHAGSAAAGKFRATALVYDASVPLPSSSQTSDAIAIALDHEDGYSVVTFLPYTLVDGKLHRGPAFTRPGTASVFKKSIMQ
jgi:hypothetical protein